ncbi:MAG: TfoX/Sxy family protein [Actinomycetota bacterium]
MAFDEALAGRVRDLLADHPGFSERKMFGGIGFMLNGNICVGVHGDDLILRHDPDDRDPLLDGADVRPFDLTGRPMNGWVLVASAATGGDGLRRWVEKGVAFAGALPPKAPGSSSMRRRPPSGR